MGSTKYVLSPISFMLREEPKELEASPALIMYFNDLYKLVLRKFVDIGTEGTLTPKDITRFREMLDELLKVKGMIHGSAYEEK